jgi:hypothetical protein
MMGYFAQKSMVAFVYLHGVGWMSLEDWYFSWSIHYTVCKLACTRDLSRWPPGRITFNSSVITSDLSLVDPD